MAAWWPVGRAGWLWGGLLLAIGAVGCAPLPTPTPTQAVPASQPMASPDPQLAERALAAAEAQLRFRAALPRELPDGAQIVRVASVSTAPPTLDVEYLVGGQRLLLRQRPAQSDPQFPPEATEFDFEGLSGRAIARMDTAGKLVQSELYWTRDGMDYALVGTMPPSQMVPIARSVVRPGST